MTSSRDELVLVPGIYLAAIYMALERDDLVPGRTHLSTWYFTLLLFTWLWSGMTSSQDELILVPGIYLAAIYMALERDDLIPG